MGAGNVDGIDELKFRAKGFTGPWGRSESYECVKAARALNREPMVAGVRTLTIGSLKTRHNGW